MIYYEEVGSGLIFVFVYGVLVDGLFWCDMVCVFSEDYCCIVLMWFFGFYIELMFGEVIVIVVVEFIGEFFE